MKNKASIDPDPIRFNARIILSESQYLAVEKTLSEILAREDHSVETCLIAGHVWLGMLSQLLAALPPSPNAVENNALDAASAETENPTELPAESGEIPIFEKTLLFYIERTRAEAFARVFQIAQRNGGNPKIKRMLLGTFISFRSSLRPRQWRLSIIARMVFQLSRHLIRLGTIRFDPMGVRLSHRDLEASTARLDAPEDQDLLRRFFQDTLKRKDLIQHSDLFWGYCYLLMVYGFVQWYASALSATRKGREGDNVSENNLTALALETVEKRFLLDPDFDQTFLYHPALADIFAHLFRKPSFAHTLVKG